MDETTKSVTMPKDAPAQYNPPLIERSASLTITAEAGTLRLSETEARALFGELRKLYGRVRK